jgi:hypothetical protein
LRQALAGVPYLECDDLVGGCVVVDQTSADLPPFGGVVSIAVPLIASLPEAPDVSIVRLRATLGPDGVTYYEHVPGETLDYQPPGILLPPTCPRGGFPFAAQFNFVDGSHASARTVDPCPAKVARRGRRR